MSNKPESPTTALVNIACNIVIPVYILNNFTDNLGALKALLFALAFPIGFFLFEYNRTKKTNWISVLGIINTLLTGGFALFQLEGKWFTVKEAAFPLLIGIFVYLSSFYGKRPFIESLLLNPNMLKLDVLEKALEANNSKVDFYYHVKKTNVYLAYSFFLSAIFNCILALWIFTEIDPTLAEVQRSAILNDQISRMTWMGYVVILLPSIVCLFFIFQYLAKGIHKHTGIHMMELMQK
jgi:intracellular septation protein A